MRPGLAGGCCVHVVECPRDVIIGVGWRLRADRAEHLIGLCAVAAQSLDFGLGRSAPRALVGGLGLALAAVVAVGLKLRPQRLDPLWQLVPTVPKRLPERFRSAAHKVGVHLGAALLGGDLSIPFGHGLRGIGVHLVGGVGIVC